MHTLAKYTFPALMMATFALSACGGEEFDNWYDVPDTIQTNRVNKFKMGKVFLDARNMRAALVEFKAVQDGVVGEQIYVSTMPVGRDDELTMTFSNGYKLKSGSQQIQLTIYEDKNSDGKLDSGDVIVEAWNGKMQKIITVEFSPTNPSYVEFQTEISTNDPKEFEVGKYFLHRDEVPAAVIAVYKDNGGQAGDLLWSEKAIIGYKNKSHTVELDDTQMLQSGKQTLHVKLHLDENENKALDADEPVLSFRDTAFEASIEVTVE